MTTYTAPTLFDSPHATAIDERTRSLLALMDLDPVHATDRAKVIRAIVETALARDDRLVNPNEWRPLLRDEHGQSTVHPNVVGATVAALKAVGVLVNPEAGQSWTPTEGSTTGNNGKPARVYRLAQLPEEVR